MTPDQSDFRRSATRLRRLLTLATWCLAFIIVAERLGYAGAYRPGQFDPRELAVQLALSLPAFMNLAALWFLRSAVASAAKGELFGKVVVLAFRRVGALLAAGA